MSEAVLLQQMAMIAILVLVGLYLQKRGVLDELTTQKLSVIVIDVANPALILSTILTGKISATHTDLLISVAVNVGLYGALAVFGVLIPRILRVPRKEQKFYNMMTVYGNVGFIGIPLAQAILSSRAMLYVIVCNVFYNLMFYTHGILVLGGKNRRLSLRNFFSPGILASVLTLLLFWFDLSLPTVFSESISYIGNATVFLSMSLLGASLARYSDKNAFRDRCMWIFMGVRMVLIPAALVIVLRLLHLPEEIVQTFCLMAAMPVGNSPLIQTEKNGENTATLSRGIMVSTLSCFFTISILFGVLF